jgi:hypothetical protein
VQEPPPRQAGQFQVLDPLVVHVALSFVVHDSFSLGRVPHFYSIRRCKVDSSSIILDEGEPVR